MTKDTGAPAQDSEIIISIFNPHRENLGPNFRSITVLKNRYGEADVEVGCAFYGAVSVFAELPKPDDIYDYEKYSSSEWLLEDSSEDNIKIEDESSTQKYNFIL